MPTTFKLPYQNGKFSRKELEKLIKTGKVSEITAKETIERAEKLVFRRTLSQSLLAGFGTLFSLLSPTVLFMIIGHYFDQPEIFTVLGLLLGFVLLYFFIKLVISPRKKIFINQMEDLMDEISSPKAEWTFKSLFPHFVIEVEVAGSFGPKEISNLPV